MISGNTFGARTFSHGKTIAPMLPEFPNITRCSKCKTIFWLKRAKKIAELNFSDPLWQNIKYDEEAKFLTTKEYIEALKKKSIKTGVKKNTSDFDCGGASVTESEVEMNCLNQKRKKRSGKRILNG